MKSSESLTINLTLAQAKSLKAILTDGLVAAAESETLYPKGKCPGLTNKDRELDRVGQTVEDYITAKPILRQLH